MGRPSSYTQEIGDAICERISSGDSLRTICSEDGFPDKATVFRWLAADVEFRDQYACAREVQAECYAEEIVTIADTVKIGVKTKESEDGIETTTGDMVERSKLQIDSRKWIVSKLLAKKYGDKQQIEHSGGINLGDLSDDELQAKLTRFGVVTHPSSAD
jgi:hypothetical protein